MAINWNLRRVIILIKIKWKITLTMLVSLVMLFLLFTFSFQYFFDEYFAEEAEKALETEIDYVLEEALYEQKINNNLSISEDVEYEINNSFSEHIDTLSEERNLFLNMINYFYVDENYKPLDSEIYYIGNSVQVHTKDAALLNYCKENADNIRDKEIYRLNTENGQYFFTQINYSNLINENKNTEIYIIYVNIDLISKFSKTINNISIVIILIIGFLMGIIGMIIGQIIEKKQERQIQFFQNASHELKTPLMSIQGYAEGIQTGIIDTQKAADIIIDESEKMSELVEELLCVSKIDSKQMTLKYTQIDIKEFLYDCIRSMEAVFDKKKILINIDFPKETIYLYGDEVQLRKVFLNILSNSIRYVETEIIISCKQVKENILISIQDDGKGIDSLTLNHLFERFYTGKDGNTGIGLSLSKEIIKLHNGKIKAENNAKGACFIVEIPLRKNS